MTGRSFEHRRQWVEDRIHELAGIFGVAIWGYAVMSNHLHVVVQILPEEVSLWSKEEVVKRWMRLYPRQDQDPEIRAEVLAGTLAISNARSAKPNVRPHRRSLMGVKCCYLRRRWRKPPGRIE